VPLHGPAAGLYLRLWSRAFPDRPATPDHDEQLRSYERLHGPRIDELEAQLHTKLRVAHRLLGDVRCDGRHYGQAVHCRHAVAASTSQ